MQTNADGAGDTALAFEQRIQDLCHGELFEHGTGTEVAYDLISNELLLDGSARLNLATFVTTWMPPPAAALTPEMLAASDHPPDVTVESTLGVGEPAEGWHLRGPESSAHATRQPLRAPKRSARSMPT